MNEVDRETQIPFPRCACGEIPDIVCETPRYSVMRCDNKQCANFDKPLISRNYRYLKLLELLIEWV